MRPKYLSIMMAGALLLCLCIIAVPASAAKREVCSNCTYTTIQDAINISVEHDEILIHEGTYTGFIVDKPNLSFQANYSPSTGYDNVTVIGGPYEDAHGVIRIMANETNLLMLHVRPNFSGQSTYGVEIDSFDNSIRLVDANDFYYGFFVNGTNGNYFEECSGSNNTIGLYLWGNKSVTPTDNLIYYGSFTDGKQGILVNGDYTDIFVVTIENMTYAGLVLGDPEHRSVNNTIQYNLFSNNSGRGAIELINCSDNTVYHNEFYDNAFGLYPDPTGYVSGNLVYDNLFNNSVVYGGPYSNTWNITKEYTGEEGVPNIIGGNYRGGNYWASPGQDFSLTCSDGDGDWICDSPYTNTTYNIDDRLPLANPSAGPEVDSISPSTGVNTGPISMVRIGGSGFQDGTFVFIENVSGRIYATDIVVVDGNNITCTLDLTGAPTGLYDVTVVNPDEQESVLYNEFSVIGPEISDEVNDSVTALGYYLKSQGEDITRKTISAYPIMLENPNVVLLGTWGEKTFGEGEGALVFVDDHPKANWEHPCRYFFVDDTGIIDSHDTYSPALNYLFTFVDGMKPDPAGLYTPSDPDMWKPACVENCSSYWALLVSGGTNANLNYKRYWEDLAFMYTALLDYGYDPSHIKVLISDGMETANDRNAGNNVFDDSPKDLNGDGTNENIVLANRSNLFAELDNLKATIPASGNLLVFTTAHGGWTGTANSSRLYLWNNEYISDVDFVNNITTRFSNINSITMVMGQCYGGGFNNEFVTGTAQKRVLITAANGSEPSWGSGFLNAWTTGVAGRTRYNIPDLGADTNNDKRVSLYESFEYAKARDPFASSSTEHPQKFMQPAGTDTSRFLNDCTGTATKSITVTYPDAAGITWYNGGRYLVTWNVEGITGNVNIYLYKGTSQVATVATGVPATPGEYPYMVPSSLAAATNYKIRVTDASNSNVYDMSNNYFTIKAGSGTGNLEFKTNPSGASIQCIGESCSCTPTLCTISNLAVGQHKVNVTLKDYYPRTYVVEVKAGITVTYTYTLDPIPKDANGNPSDWSPFGGLDVSSSPSNAIIWTQMDGGSEWVNQGETAAIILLAPGDYMVKVTKSGYQDSEIKPVHIWTPYPQREPEKLYFELTPSTDTLPTISMFKMDPSNPVLPVGGSINVSAEVGDPNNKGPLTAIWEWGDGTETTQEDIALNSPVQIKATHQYNTPGVFIVKLYVTNSEGYTATMGAPSYVIIYDPGAGFVTGGGWINSPPGAYASDPSLTGKATFGFVSKYVKGKTLPQGETEFQFRVADLNFKSTSYDWLVITNAKAQYKGKGTINGAGSYGFMLTAIDGQVKGADGNDKFRIKIWDIATDRLVYDNQLSAPDTADPTTVIGGGSIVIQQAKK